MAQRHFPGVIKETVTIRGKTYEYWKARYSRPGYLANGRRQRESRRFKTQHQAVEWMREQIKQAPRRAGENLTVEAWVSDWLDNKARPLAPKSRQRAEGVFRLHINPVFGHKRLDKVTVDDVLALLKSVRRKGLDENKIYMIGRSAFDDAKKRNKIPYNVFENVETPSAKGGETPILSKEQCIKLLTTINGDPLSPLFTLMLVTGMRLGEVLGLTWDRVDLDEGKIEVRQALQWLQDEYAMDDDSKKVIRPIPYKASRNGSSKPYLCTPKTKKSERDIYMAKSLVKPLKAHQFKQAEQLGITANGLVFVTDQGTPYRHENIERELDEYLTKAKLLRVTPRGLRSSQNNFQRAMGVETVTRAAGMGHLPSVNLDVYSRASEAELRKAAELVAQLIPAS